MIYPRKGNKDMQLISGKKQILGKNILGGKACCLTCPDAYTYIPLVINNGFDDHKRYG